MRWPLFAVLFLLLAPETRAEPCAAQESEASAPTPASLREEVARALEWYEAGEARRARDHLRALVAKCGEAPPSRCPSVDLARLLIALGVVLSEDCQPDAEVAFREAVRLDPGATLPGAHITAATRRLLLTARYKEYCLGEGELPLACQANEPPLPDERGRATPTGDPTIDRSAAYRAVEAETSPASIGRTLLMMQVQGGGGVAEGVPAASAGAGALVGILPISSPLVLGVRARASWLGPQRRDGNPGVGGFLVSGWLYGLRNETHFGYVLGGGGVEAYRGAARPGLHGLAGVSIRSTLVGVGVEAGVGFEPYAQWVLQVGFGRLM